MKMKQLRVSFSFPVGTAAAPATAKVVLSDGTVREFDDDPMTVAELMLEHPREVVVEFNSDMIIPATDRNRRRPIPLPADKKLEAGMVYVMLPLKRGKPASLVSEESRRVVLNASALLKRMSSSSSSYKFMPLFARACTASVAEGGEGVFVKLVTSKREKGCDNEMEITKRTDSKRLMSYFKDEDEEGDDEEMSLDNKVPDYLSRQLSGKGWKPTLDTIKEKKIEQQKLPHWLF